MAYRFEFDECPQAGLRRIAVEQASKALNRLRKDRGEEATIHECRKSLKRLKALFKLVRGGLGKAAYKREYGTVRDLGRDLSGVRDFEVMPKTLASLQSVFGLETKITEPIQAAIERAHGALIKQSNRDEIVAAAIEVLEVAKARFELLELKDASFEIVAAGVAHGLKNLREEHDTAVGSDNPEAYHEWRKSAQLHWRHLGLLKEAWPEFFAARIRIARSLAEVLGLDHDLAVLSQFVEDLPKSRLSISRRRRVLECALSRQHELRAEARAYALPLIADEPAEFAERLRLYRMARRQIGELETPICDLAMPPVA